MTTLKFVNYDICRESDFENDIYITKVRSLKDVETFLKTTKLKLYSINKIQLVNVLNAPSFDNTSLNNVALDLVEWLYECNQKTGNNSVNSVRVDFVRFEYMSPIKQGKFQVREMHQHMTSKQVSLVM